MTISSLSDAPASSSLLGAVSWLQGVVLGPVATAIAVIAVAWIGMLMLLGRLDVRRGLAVIAGCFVLSGASAIANGIRGAVGGADVAAANVPRALAPPPQVPPLPRNADPYAGAALPGH